MLPHGKQALILRANIPRIARLPSPKFPKHSNREQAHMDRTNLKAGMMSPEMKCWITM